MRMMRVSLSILLALLFLTSLALSSPPSSSHPHGGQERDPMEALLILKKAHDMGILSDEEYAERKDTLLDDITGVHHDDDDVHHAGEERVEAKEQADGGTIYTPQEKFLLKMFQMGLPKSYDDVLPTGENYWHTSIYQDVGAIDPWGVRVPLDSQIAIQERTLTRFGLNLYDGATWQIAMALAGLGDIAKIYEENILYPSSTGANVQVGGVLNIRADSANYSYGVDGIPGDMLTMITLPGNATRVVAANGVPTDQTSHRQPGAFFYRMIGPKYTMRDPLTGDYGSAWKYPYPNNDTTTPWNIAGIIHWNDWKPITGENVWGIMMGPLQVWWIMNSKNVSNFLTFTDTPDAVQLAISILPALKALKSPLGSLYHCPDGTEMFPPDPEEKSNVSNENNFSAYAALRMLREILAKFTVGTSDRVLVNALNDVTDLMNGLDSWFSKYLLAEKYDGYNVVYQGGHVKFTGEYEPVPISEVGGFAVDCQTWGMSVLGQVKVDAWYGFGTAYQIWQATKKFGGFYLDGQLAGVGYTIIQGQENNTVWSAEWTWGAIGACEKLSNEYRQAGRTDWADSLQADADSMVKLMTKPMVRCKNSAWCGGGLVQEDGSYLYANDRFFIPWGWYANPIGATCSTAWAVMYAHDFNPFVLGGGSKSPITLD